MEQINVTQNDKGYDVIFEVVNDDNTPMDLTGATEIKFNVKLEVSVLSGTCVIVGDATEGICKYVVQANDFPTDGVYKSEVQIKFGTLKTLTLPTFELVVEKEIA
jgi:hypothetical protein